MSSVIVVRLVPATTMVSSAPTRMPGRRSTLLMRPESSRDTTCPSRSNTSSPRSLLDPTMRLSAGSASFTQMAGSSAASQGSSTGSVSTAAVTVRVSAGCGSGPEDSRIMVRPQRTAVSSGSQPASREEQARIAAAETAVVLRLPPNRMKPPSTRATSIDTLRRRMLHDEPLELHPHPAVDNAPIQGRPGGFAQMGLRPKPPASASGGPHSPAPRWPGRAVRGLLAPARTAPATPPLITRPSSGAQASTVQRPSGARAGRRIGSQRCCRTSVRFSRLTNNRSARTRRSSSTPISVYGSLTSRYGLASSRCRPV